MQDNFWSDEKVIDFVYNHVELVHGGYIGTVKAMMMDYKKEHMVEPIVEKDDCEIIAFRTDDNKAILPVNLDSTYGCYSAELFELLTSSIHHIYMVKRLSDNEYFVAGNKFLADAGCELTIKSFQKCGHLTKVWSEEYGFWPLSKIQPVPPPKKTLGTTHDGKVCYEGDDFELWVIDQDYDLFPIWVQTSGWSNSYKYFFDKEKAQEYIFSNKPVEVSFNEIVEAIKSGPTFYSMRDFFKSKINQ